MTYETFTDYPLWKEASALADAVFDFSRGVEDFSLRNRMTASAVDIPFLIAEAAQSESEETMHSLLGRVEEPINELRSVLTEAKEQGFAPGADYALMQERCRNLFRKIRLAVPGGNPPDADNQTPPPPQTSESEPPTPSDDEPDMDASAMI